MRKQHDSTTKGTHRGGNIDSLDEDIDGSGILDIAEPSAEVRLVKVG